MKLVLQVTHLVLSVEERVVQFPAGVTQLFPPTWTTPDEHAVQVPFEQVVQRGSIEVQELVKVHVPLV